MRKYRPSLLLLTLLAALSLGVAQSRQHGTGGPAASGMHADHVMVTPGQVKWAPAPPSFPAGAQLAVLEGDPSKAGAHFIVRAKFPDGYIVPLHWHPTDERITVLQGTFLMGVGEKSDPAAGHELPVGSFALMPTGVRHFAQAKGETVVQVSGTGPFVINYVNPADDPRKAAMK